MWPAGIQPPAPDLWSCQSPWTGGGTVQFPPAVAGPRRVPLPRVKASRPCLRECQAAGWEAPGCSPHHHRIIGSPALSFGARLGFGGQGPRQCRACHQVLDLESGPHWPSGRVDLVKFSPLVILAGTHNGGGLCGLTSHSPAGSAAYSAPGRTFQGVGLFRMRRANGESGCLWKPEPELFPERHARA